MDGVIAGLCWSQLHYWRFKLFPHVDGNPYNSIFVCSSYIDVAMKLVGFS